MAKKKGNSEPVVESLTFEQSLRDLENIVSSLERGELGLDQSLAEYEQGVSRLRRCYALLEAAEQKVALLRGVDAEGQPTWESFQDESTTLEEKSQNRGRRRSTTTSKPDRAHPRGTQNSIDDTEGLF